MKLIKETKTGRFYRLNDGRIAGEFDSGYVRVTTKREGTVNGKYRRKPSLITDKNSAHTFYQMTKKRIENQVDRLDYILAFEERNCTEVAMLKDKILALENYIEWNVGGRVNLAYREGYKDGKNEMANKINKLIINL